MRSKDRIQPFLKEINRIWEAHPDLRFGQLMYNLFIKYQIEKLHKPYAFTSNYNIEDSDFLEWLKNFKSFNL